MITLELAAPDWDRSWWQIGAMRALFGTFTKSLGYCAGPDPGRPDYAFAAVDDRQVRRSVVLWRDRLLIACDVASAEARWQGPAGATLLLRHRRLNETVQVHVLGAKAVAVDYLDLVGARAADRVILFYAERFSARSAVWFDAEGAPRMRILVTGLAPGSWEIWRELYLEDHTAFVPLTSGTLYFEGRPGRYYLKKLV